MAFWHPGWWGLGTKPLGLQRWLRGYERGHWRRKGDDSPPWMRATHGLLHAFFAIIVLLYWYGAVHGDHLPRLLP